MTRAYTKCPDMSSQDKESHRFLIKSPLKSVLLSLRGGGEGLPIWGPYLRHVPGELTCAQVRESINVVRVSLPGNRW